MRWRRLRPGESAALSLLVLLFGLFFLLSGVGSAMVSTSGKWTDGFLLASAASTVIGLALGIVPLRTRSSWTARFFAVLAVAGGISLAVLFIYVARYVRW
jgi:hypothetical protein